MGMNKQWNMKVFELHELEESENNTPEVTEEPSSEEPNLTDNPDQQNGSTSTEEPNPTDDPEAIGDDSSLP